MIKIKPIESFRVVGFPKKLCKEPEVRELEANYQEVINNMLKTHKLCPECQGTGAIPTMPDGEPEMCRPCNTTGEVPIYYTLEQYKEITEKDWPHDAPVWVRLSKVMDWDLSICKAGVLYHQVIIANEAGKPPADYTQEETC